MRAKALNVIETEDVSTTVRSPFLGSVDKRIGQRNLTVLRYKLTLESQWLNATQVHFLLMQIPVSIRSLSRAPGDPLGQHDDRILQPTSTESCFLTPGFLGGQSRGQKQRNLCQFLNVLVPECPTAHELKLVT